MVNNLLVHSIDDQFKAIKAHRVLKLDAGATFAALRLGLDQISNSQLLFSLEAQLSGVTRESKEIEGVIVNCGFINF